MTADRRDKWLRVGAVVAGGLLLALAFPPYDVTVLAFVALMPLLWAWRDASPGRAGMYGFTFGFATSALLMYWFAFFGVAAIVLVPAVCAVFVALTGVLVACFARAGVRSPWIIAAAWVVPEALRSRWPLGGMPWGELGVALHDLPVARALASVGGVPLVSFTIVVVNALLLDVAIALARRIRVTQKSHGGEIRVTQTGRRLARALAGLALVAIAVAIADATRFEPTPTGQLRFALLQGNDQNRDIPVDSAEFVDITENHFDLAASLTGTYDLIVFPESALYGDPEVDAILKERITDIAATHDAAVLVNAAVDLPDDERAHNANRLYEPDGTLQGTYAKRHLVPFGEYLPARAALERAHVHIDITRDFKPGERAVPFTVDGREVATMICFESAFAAMHRDATRDGAEAFIVTTNNRSYRRSGNSAQHVALGQMRAAETGRPVLHASISGITAVIDADGRVHERTDLFRNEVVEGTVTTTTGRTFYVRTGDLVVGLCALALVVTALVAKLSGDRRQASDRSRMSSR